MWYRYLMEYYLAIKKNEMLPFAATCKALEGIMLSDITRQRETNTVCYHFYVESKKIEQVNEYSKTETDSQI